MNPSRLPFRLLPLIQLTTEKTRNRWLTRRKREPRSRWLFGALATVLAICILAPAGSAQTYQILFNFSGGMVGATPGGLTIDAAGRLYGTTFGGGGGGGTAFRLSRNGSGWVLTTLYSFNGTSHGSAPGILVFGPDGNLYGATSRAWSVQLRPRFSFAPAASCMQHNDLPMGGNGIVRISGRCRRC